MLTRHRFGLAWVFSAALAAAALWGLWGGDEPPDSAHASHGTNPSGQIWASGSVSSTWLWKHVNDWACGNWVCAAASILADSTECVPRAASAAEALTTGCGHSRTGWRWTGHGTGTGDNLGGAIHTCSTTSLGCHRPRSLRRVV